MTEYEKIIGYLGAVENKAMSLGADIKIPDNPEVCFRGILQDMEKLRAFQNWVDFTRNKLARLYCDYQGRTPPEDVDERKMLLLLKRRMGVCINILRHEAARLERASISQATSLRVGKSIVSAGVESRPS